MSASGIAFGSLKNRILSLQAVSSFVLVVGVGTLVAAIYATFPREPEAPPPPAAMPELAPDFQRLVTSSLLDRLPSAQVELPALAQAAAQLMPAVRGIELPPIEGLRGLMRKAAVAVALGVGPGETGDVDHHVRHALLLPPPGRVAWSLSLPATARFDGEVTCIATGQGAVRTVRLAMALRDPAGTVLRRDVRDVPCETPEKARWRHAPWDLAAAAGRGVTFELSSSLPSLGGKGTANLLVGNPRIVGQPEAVSKGQLPNILFVNVDTLQAAVTGIGGSVHKPTPHIDQLAAEGAFFNHAYAVSNWTRPSNLAFLTGRYPSEHGLKTVMIPSLPEERRSYYMSGIVALPLHLARHGYRTRAIAQNNLLEDVMGTGADVGFAEYEYVREDFFHSQKITAAAMEFLRASRDERWFLYLSYNAPHFPYRPSRDALWRTDFANETPVNWQEALYRGEVNLTDAYIGRLLQTVANLGLTRDTLVIVNADHGEQLAWHHAQEIIREGTWEADQVSTVKTRPGHETLFDETVRVPWVMRWPGHITPGQRVESAVALYDLPPTVLDLIGLPPLANVRGRSLVPALAGQALEPKPILIEGKSIRGLVDWPFKYIRRDGLFEWMRPDRCGEPWRRVPEELYDLVKDPEERHDLAGGRPDRLVASRMTLASLMPKPRFVYFFSARSGKEDKVGRATIRLTPASAVDQVHLLDDSGPVDERDTILREQEVVTITLELGPGDVDTVAFTTQSPAAVVTLDVVQEPAGQGEPLRAGAMRLPMQPGPMAVSDGDFSQLLDASADPEPAARGLFLWRIPLLGGIKGRGARLEQSVEQTFKAWGYGK